MSKNSKRLNKGVVRIAIIILVIIIQICILALLAYKLKQNTIYLYTIFEAIGLVKVFKLINKYGKSPYTILWTIIILVIPVFGELLYFLWGKTELNGQKSKRMKEILLQTNKWLKNNSTVQSEFIINNSNRKRISNYLEYEGFPIYKGTKSDYFNSGTSHLHRMIEDIEKAEKFIFLEYYIVAKGEVWNQIHYVLKQKAAEGVEIRLLYDDVGSIMTLSDSLIKQLRAEGIQVMAFNPAHKFILRLYINYRNHQRIVVIDGNIGYTGGANINDECVNLRSKYGYWKDTAIRLKGDAVCSMEHDSYISSNVAIRE